MLLQLSYLQLNYLQLITYIPGNKKLTKDEYYGHSILLLESVCEVKNKYFPQTFLDEFFETHTDNNINRLLQLLIGLMMTNITINRNKYSC